MGVVLGSIENGAQPVGTRSNGPPPLQVDKGRPLLLDDSVATEPQVRLPKLICYDCHGNYREESLAFAMPEWRLPAPIVMEDQPGMSMMKRMSPRRR